MTAIACLRVLVGPAGRDPAVAGVVRKVGNAFLETRWRWPRRHGEIAPFAFALADPRALRLDARELQDLAVELHAKLFGEDGVGDIALLMFEGDQTLVMRAAAAHEDELPALIEQTSPGTRVCRITRHGVISLKPPGGPVEGAPPREQLAATRTPSSAQWLGVYNAPRETFIGSVVLVGSGSDGDLTSDLAGIAAGEAALEHFPAGVVFMPVSFSHIIKPSARAALSAALDKLDPRHHARRAVAVYDTPRAPSFQALETLRGFFAPHFELVDLRVSDPAFQIDDLPSGMANSITLTLPRQGEAARLAAIERFAREAEHYKRKLAWQGVTDVRTEREVDACLKHHVPFLTGPAITDRLHAPLGVSQRALLTLPVRDWWPA